MIDALIFDVDGTLWDARVPIAHSWNRTIREVTGRESGFTPEYLGTLFGRTMEDILSVLFPDLSEGERSALGQALFVQENAWLEREPGRLYPGVAETLERLSAKLPCYIVSNCQQGYIEVLLRTSGLGKYFSGTLCYGDTGDGKGKNLVTLCQRYGLQNPVYVGDTQGDAQACAEAGIPMVYAAYGLGEVEQPWRTIRAFPELLELADLTE